MLYLHATRRRREEAKPEEGMPPRVRVRLGNRGRPGARGRAEDRTCRRRARLYLICCVIAHFPRIVGGFSRSNDARIELASLIHAFAAQTR